MLDPSYEVYGQSDSDLDEEWLELILQARSMGLTAADVRQFFASQRNQGPVETEKIDQL